MLKIATYNIQFSLHPHQLQQNILALKKQGIAIICLQEVTVTANQPSIIELLLAKLGPDWQAIWHLGKDKNVQGMGNCILWNNRVLKLLKHSNVLLPYSNKFTQLEKVLSWLAGGVTTPIQRRSVIGYFRYKNKTVRLTNVHLDHNGGSKNRYHQLKFLMTRLQQMQLRKKPDFDIICGDFNILDPLKNRKEIKLYQQLLADYQDATATIAWTADLYHIDSTLGSTWLQVLIQRCHIHVRKKLDFIWVKNTQFAHSQVLKMPGSDHLPIITSLVT